MSDVNPGGGWVKLYRVPDSWLWKLPDAWFRITLWLLCRARWQEGVAKIPVNGSIVEVPKGSWFGSQRLVADDLEYSRSTVKRTFEFLKQEGFLRDQQHGRKGTLYTIVNYGVYQGGDQQATRIGSIKRPTADPSSDPSHKKRRRVRREEEDRPLPSLRSGEASCPPTSSGKSEPEPEHVVLELECRNGIGHLRQTDVDVLQSAFPTLDVLQSCRSAMGWLSVNIPSKRWTTAGLMRGLHRWCQRDLDDGKNLIRSTGSSQKKPAVLQDWTWEERREVYYDYYPIQAWDLSWGPCPEPPPARGGSK